MSKMARLVLCLSITVVTCAALGIVLLSSAQALGGPTADFTIDTERSFAAGRLSALEIKTISTDVRFHEAPGPKLRVHFHGTFSGPAEERPVLTAFVEGGTLHASIEHPRTTALISWSTHANLVLDVYAPRKAWSRIRIGTTSGNATAGAIEAARFEFRSVSGRLSASKIKAKQAELRTTSGEVRADKLSGDVNFSSISGDLQIMDFDTGHSTLHTTSGQVRLPRLRGGFSFRSVSGGLTAGLVALNGDIRTDTTSGDVELTLPAGARFTLDFRTTTGRLECEFPLLTSASGDRRRTTGTVGNGGKKIEARSVSGALRILKH